MSDFRPVGKNLLLLRDFGGQKTTESGIIYNEKITCKLVWSKVAGVGDQITEDIKVGDRVLWDITKLKGNHYKEYDVVHQDHIYMVERE